MSRKLLGAATFVLLSLCAFAVPCTARPAPPIDATIRELNEHPTQYLGKKVRVVGYVTYRTFDQALNETLDDLTTMATLARDQRRGYPGTISFRGGEDWLRSPLFAGHRSKIRAEGIFSNLCAPAPAGTIRIDLTCHNAHSDNILVSARIVELLAPGKAFKEPAPQQASTVKRTPSDWPAYAEVRSRAMQMLRHLRTGAWNEVVAGVADDYRGDFDKWVREYGTSGRSVQSDLADTYAEIPPDAADAIMLFDDQEKDVTLVTPASVRVSSVRVCFCRKKSCAGKWPTEPEQLRYSGGARRQLPFVCQEFQKRNDQPWKWEW